MVDRRQERGPRVAHDGDHALRPGVHERQDVVGPLHRREGPPHRCVVEHLGPPADLSHPGEPTAPRAAVACAAVAEILTLEWVAELAAAASGAEVDPDLRLVVQQVVTDSGLPVLTYAVRVEGGRVAVVAGEVDGADVTFTQDRRTAEAIAAGLLSAQAAFMAGDLRVGGDLQALSARARELAVLDDVFGAARA